MHTVRFESHERDFKTWLFSHRGAHYLYLVDNVPFFFSAATIRCGGGFKIYFAHAGR